MWNDNDTNIDLLDVEHLLIGIRSIIDKEELIPCTIGVFGDWGSGKSSLIRMLEDQYGDDEGTLVIKFNGWLFEGYEDAKTVLMGTIIENVIKEKKLENGLLDKAWGLLKRVNILKLIKSVGAVGAAYFSASTGDPNMLNVGLAMAKEVDFNGVIKDKDDGNNAKSLRMGIQEFHKDFSELLEMSEIKKLLILIDDLDRCSPETIIATLEAIKLFLYVQNTVFVISADEKLIEYAVRKRFPDLEGMVKSASRNYLEKLVQHPIRIPRLSAAEMEIYITLLFISNYFKDSDFNSIRKEVLKAKYETSFHPSINFETYKQILSNRENNKLLEEDLLLAIQIAPTITQALDGNPRQCKRFLNMLMLRLKIAEVKKLDIKKKILAKIMLLEYFRNERFIELFRLVEQSKEYKTLFEESDTPSVGKKEESEQLKKKIKNSEISEMRSTWEKDDWMKDWLKNEPSLKNINLEPYYYLTREKLSGLKITDIRVNTTVENLYNILISGSDTVRDKELKKLSNFEQMDVRNTYNLLKSFILQTDESEKSDFALISAIRMSAGKSDLMDDMLKFIEIIPLPKISQQVFPEITSAIKNTNCRDEAIKLLEKFANSETKSLAKLANMELAELRKQ